MASPSLRQGRVSSLLRATSGPFPAVCVTQGNQMFNTGKSDVQVPRMTQRWQATGTVTHSPHAAGSALDQGMRAFSLWVPSDFVPQFPWAASEPW